MTEQQVVFKLDNVEYAIAISQVNEIVKVQEVTKLPNTADYVEGIINLRGKVIPVVDLKIKFKLGQQAKDDATRIIIVQVNDKTIGMLVDEVTEVLNITEEQIDTTSEMSVSISEDYLRGVAKVENRLIILLKLEQVFNN